MNPKIAIQFFGQLRYVEVQHSIYSFLKYFRDRGFEVDLYGTFWDDEYTVKQVKTGSFKDFKSVKLLPEPKLNDGDLKKYFYSLEKTINQRKGKYEFIIFCRYDIDFIINEEFSLSKFYEKVLDQLGKPSIFFIPNTRYDNRIDDKLFICNQPGAEKICHTYSKFKNKELNIPLLRYHTSLLDSIKFFKLELFENIKFFSYNLIRHEFEKDIKLDHTLEYDGELLRDYIKKFQDFYKMKKFLENFDR